MNIEVMRLAQESYEAINAGLADHDPKKPEFVRWRDELVTFGAGIELTDEQRLEGLRRLMEVFRSYMRSIANN